MNLRYYCRIYNNCLGNRVRVHLNLRIHVLDLIIASLWQEKYYSRTKTRRHEMNEISTVINSEQVYNT